MNPKIEIGDAGAKGKGLFANAVISKGELVFIQGGRIINDEILSVPPYRAFDTICIPVERGFYITPHEPNMGQRDAGFYINHSCDPNCGIRGQITFVAMRAIRPGEELTYDYAMTDSDASPMICFCAAQIAVKPLPILIGNEKTCKKKYRGFFSRCIQDLIDAQSTV